MSKTILVFIISLAALFSSFLFFKQFVLAATTPTLNEIMPNPSAGYEWVEIYNPDNLNIDDWTIEEEGGSIYQLGANLTDNAVYDIFEFTVNKLNNTSDTITLKSADASIVESYHWGSTQAGVSFAKIPDGGEWSTLNPDTKAAANQLVSPTPTLTPSPTISPTTEPTVTPTPSPTATPIATATVEPTIIPTSTPIPTLSPTIIPTATATPSICPEPTLEPGPSNVPEVPDVPGVPDVPKVPNFRDILNIFKRFQIRFWR